MNKKTKTKLIQSSIVMILLAVLIVIIRGVPPSYSANNGISFDDTTVNNLRFNNVRLINNQLVGTVQNTTSSTYNLALINVKVKDESGNVLTTLTGYIGESLNADEIRNLNIKTDKNLSNAKTVEYEVQIYFKRPIRLHLDGINDYTIEKDLGLQLGDINEPTRNNYAFNGWYLDEEYTQEASSSLIVTKDLTDLYAKWVEMYYLYDNGNKHESKTGGWQGTADKYATFSDSDNYFYFSNTNSSYIGVAVTTVNKVDLGGRKYLKVDIDRFPTGWGSNYCDIILSKSPIYHYSSSSDFVAAESVPKVSGRQTVTLEIPSEYRDGSYYVGIQLAGPRPVYTYAIWLE